MRRAILPALVLLPFLTTGPAKAATEQNFGVDTTADLVALCSADSKEPIYTAAVNFCHGFMVGAVRVMQEHNEATRHGRLFCLPSPMPSRAQSIENFVRWAQESPSHLSMRPVDAVYAYLGGNYPCRRKR
jgi:hypothetical protein